MPVRNNEHQRINDVVTDLISYGIQSLETICFLYNITYELFDCFVKALSVTMTVSLNSKLHDLVIDV